MQPFEGGSRWAVGVTKADPRAERLSGDAGPGREWIVVGEVNDDLFDMRIWLALFYSMLPPGRRDPDSPFFVNFDMKIPLTYSILLDWFRKFLAKGGCTDAHTYGVHGVRSEAFVTCAGAVSAEAAVIQGGWAHIVSASRYDRLIPEVVKTMASKMVKFHVTPTTLDVDSDEDVDEDFNEASRVVGNLGVVAARAHAHGKPAAQPRGEQQDCHQPIGLPEGWRRVWHPTSGRNAGYASFAGPGAKTARSLAEAKRMHSCAPTPTPPPVRAPARPAPVVAQANGVVPFPVRLEDHVVFGERPSGRPPPRSRSRLGDPPL